MKKLLLIVLLFVGILATVSCRKDANSFKNISAMVVFDSGDPAATGCGYTIKIDNSMSYYPINLSNSYQKDQLKINVSYHLLSTKHQCGLIPSVSNELQEINIDEISTK